MLRYLRLLALQLRTSLLLALQYRLDFVIKTALALVWVGVALVPLLVLFHQREQVAGWRWPEALIVVGWFTVLKGLLEGAIRPALQDVVERIRTGALDFLLIKPVDSQFLVSTARFELWKLIDTVAGLVLVVYGLRAAEHRPSIAAIAMAALLLLTATVILYSIWIMLVGLAFVAVKVDNLSYLFGSIYEAARWPASVFRGALSVIFTFVIPLAVMTTFPALAILDRLPASRLLLAVGIAVAFATLSRLVWLMSVRRYSSAGG